MNKVVTIKIKQHRKKSQTAIDGTENSKENVCRSEFLSMHI